MFQSNIDMSWHIPLASVPPPTTAALLLSAALAKAQLHCVQTTRDGCSYVMQKPACGPQREHCSTAQVWDFVPLDS